MNVLALAVIAGYIVSLLLRWSQNHSIVVGWPIFLMDWTRRTVFMALTFVLTYGSIIGIWYLFGIWIALGASVVKLIVGRVSFHHYYKRAIDEHAEWEYQQMLRDRRIAHVPLDQLDPIDQMMRTSGLPP
jgi:hypothetical protein